MPRDRERGRVRVLTTAEPSALRSAVAAPGFTWIDLTAPDADALDALAEVLPLHPLALANSRDFDQRPKVDRYDDATLIVAFGAETAADGSAAPVEVHLHVAPGFLVTVHRRPVPALADLHRFTAAEPPRPEDAIVFRVLDALVRTLDAAVDAQAGALEALEDAMLARARRAQLGQVAALRHAVARLLRGVSGERDVATEIERAVIALPELDPAARPYLRDLGDRLARAEMRLTAQQAALSTLTDTFFNASAYRLTVVSERLTAIATVVVPLTLVTGFFGQNFGWLVERIDSLTAFLVFGVGGMVLPTLVALVYLRRQGRDLP